MTRDHFRNDSMYSGRKSFEELVVKDLKIPTSDGIELSARAYLPSVSGQFSTLFAASPFGYETDCIPGNPMFLWYDVGPIEWYVAERGYAYVHLDVRGTGKSDGSYGFLDRREARDSFEVIEWIAGQDWSNGRIGGFGKGYYAMAQWAAAALKPPHLTCIAPFDGGVDPYRDALYNGGIPSGFAPLWLHNIRAINYYRFPGETGRVVEQDNLLEILTHHTDDEFWRERAPFWSLENIEIPVFSIGLWSSRDNHLRGNILGYQKVKGPKKLALRKSLMPIEAFNSYLQVFTHERLLLPFYDHYLEGKDTSWKSMANVTYFVSAADTTEEAETWPPPATEYHPFYFNDIPSGSVTSLHDGGLQGGAAGKKGGSVSLRYPDPLWKLGNAAVGLHGPDAIARNLTFTSNQLPDDIKVVGNACLYLYLESDQVDTDIFVKLVEQIFFPPDQVEIGKQPPSIPVAKGWLKASHRAKDEALSSQHHPFYKHEAPESLKTGRVYEFEIELSACAHLFRRGSRIRVDLSNTDSPITEGPFGHLYHWQKVGTDTIHFGGVHPSRIELPIMTREAAAIDKLRGFQAV